MIDISDREIFQFQNEFDLPVQPATGSPSYPVLHAHVKDPSVSVHSAFSPHGDVTASHSSMS